mmetsp:Transcript_24041/g.50211  ORF Transcript_24041/g.50211 Transcript_24041/m.50211 type:complete len:579 (+) Transcript_24041:3-1739(+)
MALRNWEFTSAFRAELRDYVTIATGDRANEPRSAFNAPEKLRHFCDSVKFSFQDALLYQGPIFYPSGDCEGCGSEERRANLDIGDIKRLDGTPVDGEVEPITLSQAQAYESAMQYVTITLPTCSSKSLFHVEIDHEAFSSILINTIRRCSLIRTAFRIASEGETYDRLATCALKNGSFLDMIEGGSNEDCTWSLRLRRYGSGEAASSTQDGDKIKANNCNNKTAKQRMKVARYGKNVRSPLKDEKDAILSMAHLVARFKGKVCLANPDCKIYLLEGLQNRLTSRRGEENKNATADNNSRGKTGTMFLARVIAQGPKTSIYAPKTRICVTTTPLCPLASFTLSNIAQLSRISNPAVLDPFAGSCATLLAAAHITSTNSSSIFTSTSYFRVANRKEIQQNPNSSGTNMEPTGNRCRSVGIEFLHSSYVNRDNIVEDFRTRNLDPPIDIIRGDCLSSDVRALALKSVGGSFDAIVTDPPYGIREAMSRSNDAKENATRQDDTLPLTKLCYAIGEDRCKGSPLLKSGGRLVAFIPVKKGATLQECLPHAAALNVAGLRMEEDAKEQVLSDMLSRWIVSFISE